ncbi:MAG: DNA damage-inducible protein D [Chloroflexia bacterium]
MSDDESGSPFEAVRHETEEGEYWTARELAVLLGYTNWRNFAVAIGRAQLACRQSGRPVTEHFDPSIKSIPMPKGGSREVADWRLSRFACYLIVQNADPAKEIVAAGQIYFADQTRRQELASFTEAQQRLDLRDQLTGYNKQLAEAAHTAGVIEGRDFAVFQDHGYMGLYNGERARDIAARKRIEPGEKILDHMSSEELGANIFRATQTDAKIRREGIQGKERANRAHYQVGQVVRQTIQELGGTMPEELPTPAESIKALQREERKRLKSGPQKELFPEQDGET